MVRHSDTYEAYYLCRLAEVTSKSASRSLPRLTTAQATLGSRRALDEMGMDRIQPTLSQGISDAVSEMSSTGLSPLLGSTMGSAIMGSTVNSTTSSRASIFNHASTDAKSYWNSKGQIVGSQAGLSSKMRAKISSKWSHKSASSLPGLGRKSRQTSAQDDPEKPPEPSFEEIRAHQILKEARFFKDLDPALLAPVPKCCTFVKEPNGLVLFRQGDPPSNCYIIVSGAVGFFVGGNLKSPRKPVTEGLEDVKVPSDRKGRVNTREGWSTYSLDSRLGRCVKTAQAGEVFAELALMDDSETRKATAKCVDDCELLCIPTMAFENVRQHVKEVEQKKRAFLGECVPGMRDLPTPGPKDPPHPAIYFQQQRSGKGHVFLRQDCVEDDVFFVVVSGEVNLTRAKEGSDEPGEAKEEIHHTIGIGAIFGSLPHSAKEPFTVVAATPCEVWKVNGADFERLPKDVVEGVQAKISCDTACRMRRCFVSKRMGWDQQRRHKAVHRPKEDVATEWLGLPSRELKTQFLKPSYP